MADKYQALLGKLKEATGPFCYSDAFDRALMLYKLDSQEGRLLRAALLGRIDATGAALALVGMALPGWQCSMNEAGAGWSCWLKSPNRINESSRDLYRWIGEAPTLPLAILIAWCEAMIAKEQRK